MEAVVYEKMDQPIKTEWVAELRSGKREQGQKKLRDDDDRFCCLGVLMDVVHKGDWYVRDVSACSGGLLNLTELRRVKLEDDAQTRLAAKNDNGETFLEIADWIEANL